MIRGEAVVASFKALSQYFLTGIWEIPRKALVDLTADMVGYLTISWINNLQKP
jgi:hypothetical protein